MDDVHYEDPKSEYSEKIVKTLMAKILRKKFRLKSPNKSWQQILRLEKQENMLP